MFKSQNSYLENSISVSWMMENINIHELSNSMEDNLLSLAVLIGLLLLNINLFYTTIG